MEDKSEIRRAIEKLSMTVIVKPADKNANTAFVSTESFLSLCYIILQVLGELLSLKTNYHLSLSLCVT